MKIKFRNCESYTVSSDLGLGCDEGNDDVKEAASIVYEDNDDGCL